MEIRWNFNMHRISSTNFNIDIDKLFCWWVIVLKYDYIYNVVEMTIDKI